MQNVRLPLVIEYLKTHTFGDLERDHGVLARPNSNYDKFSLNYDMLVAKTDNQLANECRGMVIRTENSYDENSWLTSVIGDVKLLAWPMCRFFNHGDTACAPIDFNDRELAIYEKLDGTCCILYYDDIINKWCVATRSMPEANLPIHGQHLGLDNMSFTDLFMKAAGEMINNDYYQAYSGIVSINDWLETRLVRGFTYVFELTSPYNRVVVRYNDCRLTLLSIRKHNGVEMDIKNLRWAGAQIGIPVANSTNFAVFNHDIDELIKYVNASDPANLEGVVVCDSNHNRVKIKNIAWVASSRAKDLVTTSRRNAVDIILRGKLDDILPLLDKDIVTELLAMQEAIGKYLVKIDDDFNEYKKLANGSRKEFALLVKKSGEWETPFFNLWEGKYSSTLSWIEAHVEADRVHSGTLDLILKKIGWYKPSIQNKGT